MKFKELKTKEEKELGAMVEKAKEDLEAMKFKVSAGQLKNVREMRKAKKLIARILTLKNEKKTGKNN